MHRVLIRPLFGDVDAMNVVYYSNYLKFFEQGRAELMRISGRPYAELAEMGLHLPVTEAHLNYRQSVLYDQLVALDTHVAWVKKASLRFDYRLVEPSDNGHEVEMVTGFTTHACVDLNGKIRPLPDWVVALAHKHIPEHTEA